MKVYSLYKEQILPIELEEAWKFFSNPANLNSITPDNLLFKIRSNVPRDGMYEGMMIEYQIKPILNIPVTWLTEITNVKTNHYFIDEQRIGPYAIWHHEHHFEIHEQGVKMIDKLLYVLPLGIIGELAHKLFVGKRIKEIFDFRYQKLSKLFPNNKP
ncbi:MAG: hypothetical protein CL840_11360 [Crocinitomicaceae bacterium]|nr:hypothetical protein [Crocinitomicaceae bacterium]|tara:strand:- start:3762 stop:4232 length:471 start_codon:yes stop_codon:yes gene_type:complete